MHERESIAVDLVKGALAGAAATWIMNRVTTRMYELESDAAKARENDARGGKTAYAVAAEKAAGSAGIDLPESRRDQAATAIHFATGIAAGMFYAALRRRNPLARTGRGLLFGAAWFLAVDELMNVVLGLTPGPQKFPWQTHARGLGGHLAFGVANEIVLEGLDRVA